MYLLRFDMRSPAGAPTTDLYRTAIEMAEWGEQHGCIAAMVCEHHGSSDGYLPSPLVLASAIAARTTRLPIMVGALLLNFYDPIKLAEDMVVLDHVSGGRVSYIVGLGYRPEEYDMFGVDMTARGKLIEQKLDALRRALSGERFTYEGRTVHVTPAPATPGGPRIMVAGGSRAAARRAGRHGLGLLAFTDAPGLREEFEAQSRAHGHQPGPLQVPDGRSATTVFVAEDVDRGWSEIGTYLLHDATMAAAYRHGDETVASITAAETVSELRSAQGPYEVVTIDDAAARIRAGGVLPLHPLCGGLPPELGWPYLECAAVATERAGGQ